MCVRGRTVMCTCASIAFVTAALVGLFSLAPRQEIVNWAALLSRALEQACKTDALLEKFSSQLVADLQLPNTECGRGWLHGEPRKVEKLVTLCLAKLNLAGPTSTIQPSFSTAADPKAAQSENTWQVSVFLLIGGTLSKLLGWHTHVCVCSR